MVRHIVRFTEEAEADLLRLYDFLLEKNPRAAKRALAAIRRGIAMLETSPYSCRKAGASSVYIRELVIPFGKTGYVVLFEIERPRTVTIIAARHQREDDYR
ncbi:MAG: type II toxin-antitoxin system RelE/ParE family toxin [Deltaproteobacteria bacterium]|nr:type II toxin-antitoxin system RelE/ParE family toxin [Deltaproteobacteria bacterium]